VREDWLGVVTLAESLNKLVATLAVFLDRELGFRTRRSFERVVFGGRSVHDDWLMRRAI
jgi:hypothetical protein